MNRRDWQLVSRTFEELCELEPHEREKRLLELEREAPEVAGELRAMLAADAGGPGVLAQGVAPFAAALVSDVAVGTRLGPYEIVEAVDAGGMGEVFKARDTRLERFVAIKILRADRADSEDLRQRFEREARAISRLQHPHICTLFDVARESGTDFLVMEFLEGESLASRLARGPLPLEQALRTGIELAEALGYAHRQGIVHRDVKPGNVILTKSGAKLLDFGLARLHTAEPRAPSKSALDRMATRERPLTTEGAVLGTYQYMSPEQVEGKTADPRTDVFALGSVLFEMVSGRPAFASETRPGLIAAILSSEPPVLSQLQPLSPPALDHLVATCLAKDPDERWQSADDVGKELRFIAGAGSQPGAAPAVSRSRERLAWVIATLAFAGMIALLARGSLEREPSASPRPTRFLVQPPAGTVLTGMLELSPDGHDLVFVALGDDGVERLYHRPLDRVDAAPIEGSEGAQFPFFSPDGRGVAFFARERLRRVDLDTGDVSTLCRVSGPRGGSWSSRGTIVFAADAGGRMHTVPEAGGEPVVLAHLAERNGAFTSVRWPRFLADGDRFLYFHQSGDSSRQGVYLTSLAGQEPRLIAASDSAAVLLGPDRVVFRRGELLYSQALDAETLIPLGAATPLAEGVWWDALTTSHTGVTAGAGVLAFQTGGIALSELRFIDRSGTDLGAVTEPGAYIEPAISPTGERIAVTRGDPETGTVGIWIRDLERGGWSRLSSLEPVVTPVWSADGRRIAYSSLLGGGVLARQAGGAGSEELLARTPRFWPLEDWSSDGRFLVLTVLEPTKSDLWLVDLEEGTEPTELLATGASESQAGLAPDGRHLAYVSDESGLPEVYIQPFPSLGSRTRVSVEGGTQPAWRADGRELYYIGVEGSVMAVELTESGGVLEAAVPERLFGTRILPLVEARNHYDVTGDGRRFLVNSRFIAPESQTITVWTGL